MFDGDSIRKRFLSFFMLLALMVKPLFAADETSLKREIQPLIETLVKTGAEVKKRKDLSPIRGVVGGELQEWYVPGACMRLLKSFKKDEIKGWYPPDSGTQAPEISLDGIFNSLKVGPLVVLKDKKFDPYKPDACGDDNQAKKKEWYDKWILYPGDYLSDKGGICDDVQIRSSADWTLLYFWPDGSNLYFGLKKIQGKWIVVSVGLDDDCDA